MTGTKTRPAQPERYDPRAIESKWQERWEADGLHTVREDRTKPKFYCLDFFPYPSGDGLSVGHCRNYVPTDTISRYMRMRGYNVLHPMGWDAFGLPAENEAILKGRHPKLTVPQYTANYKRQLKMIGTSYDWTREINSSEPDYYRWTQWFFLFLYERGLAYRSTAPANWCPLDGTVLANEEVIDGACWRCGTLVVKKSLPQWFFKITAYADRLLDDLETVDWPEKIVRMQRHWIGRSEGADLSFELNAPAVAERELRVFTTRPDTAYGVTFMVLAPEHPLVDRLTTSEQRVEVAAYVEQASRRTEIDRLSTEREKTGVFTGAYVTNRFNGEQVPVWVADYVILTYGTGAIMGVPGHDQRDFDFAKQYGLRIVPVYEPPDWDGGELTEAVVHAGAMINSGRFDGLPEGQAIEAITKHAEEMGYGVRAITYRLRDWLISRQRYWGAPIPIVYCKRCGEVPVPQSDLPVLLPDIDEYAPSGTGRSPLANVPEFVNTTCPRCREPAERETDTMGGFACSSWYFLRFASPNYTDGPFEPEAMRFWLPVDLYVGGAEHAVMHLLYARFWTKVAYDAELLHFNEPFTRLMNQGIVHAADGKRMSKSQGNVITPDSVVERHGADSLRGYELFIAPFEMNVNWSDEGVRGINRWLHRVWNVALGAIATAALPDAPETRELRRWTHHTIARVTDDMERFHFNTMLSALMEFTNYLTKLREAEATVDADAWSEAVDSLLLLVAPAAPHIAEELWERAGRPYSVHQQPWPRSDAALAAEDAVEIAVQVNGKVREHLTLPVDTPEERAHEAALASDRVRPHVEGREIVRVIYVPNRLLNVVVR